MHIKMAVHRYLLSLSVSALTFIRVPCQRLSPTPTPDSGSVAGRTLRLCAEGAPACQLHNGQGSVENAGKQAPLDVSPPLFQIPTPCKTKPGVVTP